VPGADADEVRLFAREPSYCRVAAEITGTDILIKLPHASAFSEPDRARQMDLQEATSVMGQRHPYEPWPAGASNLTAFEG